MSDNNRLDEWLSGWAARTRKRAEELGLISKDEEEPSND